MCSEAWPCVDSILACSSCCAPRGPQQVTLALVQAGAALLQPAAAQGVPCCSGLLRPAAAVPAALHCTLVVALAALAQQHHLLCQHRARYVITSPALPAMHTRVRSSTLMGQLSPCILSQQGVLGHAPLAGLVHPGDEQGLLGAHLHIS